MLFATVAIMLTSCDKVINPSGNITQVDYGITGYSAIDISDAFKVNVTFMPIVQGVVIEADDNIQEFVDIKKLNDRLYIGIDRSKNFSGMATLNAYVSTSSDITGLYASGASTITLDDLLTGGTIQMEASGASQIIGEVAATKINANLSGASKFLLDGTAGSIDVTASGASDIGDFSMVIGDLDVTLSGASSASLTVNGTMDVVASGASTVYYKGAGSVNSENLSGGSQIIKVD